MSGAVRVARRARPGHGPSAAATLRPLTCAAGLSFGDRCGLAFAARPDRPAITADDAWTSVDVAVSVVPIR